jgi:hypothetical protein
VGDALGQQLLLDGHPVLRALRAPAGLWLSFLLRHHIPGIRRGVPE